MRLKIQILFLVSLILAAPVFTSAKTKKNSNGTKEQRMETIYLAGGCFWGMEDLIRKEPGITHTEVGYMGGAVDNATYNVVKTGTTGHAETVKIEFDPNKTTLEKVLLFFFKIHDPTTINRQGNDIGTQYRSAIFYLNEEQKQTALRVIERVDASKAWGNKVVTQVIPVKSFWKAEDYHQDYLVKNPNGYTCHYPRQINF